MNISTQLHRMTVKVLRGYNPHDTIEKLVWDGLSNQLLIRYRWYFEYRQALLKVQYPKNKVLLEHFRYQPESQSEIEQSVLRVQNLIVARKRKITEVSNKLKEAKASWTELFPLDQHPNYQKAMEKLFRLRQEKAEYEAQLKKLKAEY